MNSVATAYQFPTKSHVVVTYKALQQKQMTSRYKTDTVWQYTLPLLFVKKYTLATLEQKSNEHYHMNVIHL